MRRRLLVVLLMVTIPVWLIPFVLGEALWETAGEAYARLNDWLDRKNPR